MHGAGRASYSMVTGVQRICCICSKNLSHTYRFFVLLKYLEDYGDGYLQVRKKKSVSTYKSSQKYVANLKIQEYSCTQVTMSYSTSWRPTDRSLAGPIRRRTKWFIWKSNIPYLYLQISPTFADHKFQHKNLRSNCSHKKRSTMSHVKHMGHTH